MGVTFLGLRETKGKQPTHFRGSALLRHAHIGVPCRVVFEGVLKVNQSKPPILGVSSF